MVIINKCIYMYMDMTFHTFPLGDITPLSCGIQTLQHTPTGEYMIGTKVLTCYLATYMVSMPHNTTEHPHAPSPPHAPPPTHTCLPHPLLTQQRVLGHQPSRLHGCLQLAPGVEAPQAGYGVLTVHCGGHTVPVLKGGRGRRGRREEKTVKEMSDLFF